mmetsp:Transcript_823/g.1850  ORF Transcript_823/g.1850 Transcript_823/m.1850 type:complete len:87 (+) Transcript_823:960-1220(+)
MPHALILPLHCARAEADYMQAVEASIMAGGCTASRANVAGACYGALATDDALPVEWVCSVADVSHIQNLSQRLVDLRSQVDGVSML